MLLLLAAPAVARAVVGPPAVAPRVPLSRRSSRPALVLEEPPLQDAAWAPPSPSPRPELWQALVALNGCTLLWGSQHAVIKDIVSDMSPAAFNAARFGLAAVCALPWAPGAPWRPRRPPAADAPPASATWAAGAELGLWSCLGFALQSVGLETTSAGRSAFLLYLNVKLVPLLALLLYGRTSPPRTWVSALLAVCGTGLLASDGSPPNVGDAWSLAAAVASACFILRLEAAAAGAAPPEPAELNAATLTCAAGYFALLAAAEVGGAGGAAPVPLMEAARALGESSPQICYLAVVTTFVAQWLQAYGQARVGAQDAALLYALDPCYAAGFSYLLLGETLGPQGFAGAAVVLAAVAISRGGGGAGEGGGERREDEGARTSRAE